MNVANNIVFFPGVTAIPQQSEELPVVAPAMLIDGMVDHYTGQLVDHFIKHGFDVENDTFNDHFAFTVESLRSCLYHHVGLDHPMYQIIDKIIAEIKAQRDKSVDSK